MTTTQVLVGRYSDLAGAGKLDMAFNYLGPDIIYNSWLGIVEGRDNVITFMRDHVRFVNHNRNYTHWRQIQHCLEPAVANPASGVIFDSDGYDAEGYATFERDGTIASHAKFYTHSIAIKETIVVKNDQIVVISHSKRL